MIHTELDVWKTSILLAKRVYSLSKTFPKDERFGLTMQIRRASVSIASNIAEGFGRETYREIIRYLIGARGSLNEVETQYFLALELELCNPDQEIGSLITNSRRMLSGLIKKFKQKEKQTSSSHR